MGIFVSCIQELVRVGIVEMEEGDGSFFVPYLEGKLLHHYNRVSLKLKACAELAEGLSVRSLRRLPLQAHARYIHNDPSQAVPCLEFLDALSTTIDDEQKARKE